MKKTKQDRKEPRMLLRYIILNVQFLNKNYEPPKETGKCDLSSAKKIVMEIHWAKTLDLVEKPFNRLQMYSKKRSSMESM